MGQLSTAGKTFDLIDLEADIAETVRHYAPPAIRTLPMPDYVEHRDGINDLGKLSAEAVVREYEEAAKAIEAMATELTERARQCETMVRETAAISDEVKEIAAAYREEAKRIFLHVEDCALMTAEVRKACADLRSRIAAPVVAKTEVPS